ncbi:MAG: hypothetical protein IKM06_02550 [Clostridia bacterium]|nr:hypothetical protein [Clostridia bacterium]
MLVKKLKEIRPFPFMPRETRLGGLAISASTVLEASASQEYHTRLS